MGCGIPEKEKIVLGFVGFGVARVQLRMTIVADSVSGRARDVCVTILIGNHSSQLLPLLKKISVCN